MKTMLILVDGMRPDGLLDIPAAKEIISRGKSTMSARTVMPSVTLPCHFSLFLSVEPARHGIVTNTYMPQVRPIDGLCETLKKAGKTSAFFYSWHELRDLARPGSLACSSFMSGGTFGYFKAGQVLSDDAVRFVTENDIDFTFLYLGHPDAAGHHSGWMGEEYMDSVRTSWDNIARVIAALPEDYTVIITADHGGHDRSHGSDLPEDMTIPLVIVGQGADRVKALDDANIMDIAPTIAALLDVPADPEWEGKCLI